MAVATPVLERKTIDNDKRETLASLTQSEEEIHNARIKENYAKLINPEVGLRELVGEPVPSRQAPREEVKPFLVENARADAAIFRADSAINMRAQVITPEKAQKEEVESEDLRPTQTTIQYRTIDEKNKSSVKTSAKETEHVLGKREKVIIAVFVSVVVALFALVIINSIIIANLNSDLAVIEQGITSARAALQNVNSQITEITSPENILQFARNHGINLR